MSCGRPEASLSAVDEHELRNQSSFILFAHIFLRSDLHNPFPLIVARRVQVCDYSKFRIREW